MPKYVLKISYDGSPYHGWQIQPNAITIQEEINKALEIFLRKKVQTLGCGRTDTGVHAKDFFVEFEFDGEINTRIVRGLNAILSKEICVWNVYHVSENFNVRFDAISREYRYYIHCHKNPFLTNTSLLLSKKPNLEKMNEAAQILLSYTDFECFSKVKTEVKTFNCTIKEAKWIVENDNEIYFKIKADRFLRNMVRSIVGTMLDIGFEKYEPKELHQIIASKNRSESGYSVPAHALFLHQIIYPENVFTEIK